MEKCVIYMGNYLYPDGNAAGKRVAGNGMAIEKLGYKVIYFCFRSSDKNAVGLIKEKVGSEIVYTIPYSRGINRVNNMVPYSFFKTVFKEISADYYISGVVLYGSLGTYSFCQKVIEQCKVMGVRVFYDWVDWYDVIDKHNYLKYLFKKKETNKLIKKILPNCDGHIVISSFLKKQLPYSNNCIIVPPLSTEIHEPVVDDSENYSFCYATFISDKDRPVSEWKDRIDAIVDIFEGVFNKGHSNFTVHFIGFTEDDLINMFIESERERYKKKLELLRRNVVFYGPLENKEVMKIIARSDYSILLRDKKHSTDAGFPTKVSESISLCVPVIVNLTSDIGDYIRNEIDGIILNDVDCLTDNINCIIKLLSEDNKTSVQRMKREISTNNAFYFENYVDRFKTLLEG